MILEYRHNPPAAAHGLAEGMQGLLAESVFFTPRAPETSAPLPDSTPLPYSALMSLVDYGWSQHWEDCFQAFKNEGFEPARVVCELRRRFYAVQTSEEETLAECKGRFFHHASTPETFPAVGDWVAIRRRGKEPRADLHAVLPRRTKFSRRAAGDVDMEQLVAANIDLILLVSGLDQNYNPARIQRFLVAARESGAEPVIVLNKVDLVPDAAAVSQELDRLVPGVPVVLTSTQSRTGLRSLRRLLRPGTTSALVGSSGVGKSSLINALLQDEVLPTSEVREKDSKGRHTTTRRELVLTASGALIIDTPGLRELQLWDVQEGLDEAFADVVLRSRHCRFTNCRHQSEPGCAVRAAVEAGELPADRVASYLKLRVEQEARATAQRRSSSVVANQPGWRQRHAETKRPGRIRPED
jgi:ribosome biogenesis GTPase / thiamine phosphate phosphatase